MMQKYCSAARVWNGPPRDFFRKLGKQFGFTLDPCARSHNAVPKYFTPDDDGLEQDWSGNTVFLNPPYGRGIGRWVQKAYEEGCKDGDSCHAHPSRTDTRYWHDYAMKADEVRLGKGRLKFGGAAPLRSHRQSSSFEMIEATS